MLSTQDINSHRFIAAHGRRALIAGYAAGDLEFWGYPFQILSGYQVSFLPAGQTTPIEGRQIVRRVDYSPNAITRVYLGPGFIVRERLFVPFDRSAAVITYTVESAQPVDIVVRASPVMNLMWPVGLGGQTLTWNTGISAYVLSERAHGYSAIVGSPQTAAHDEPDNATTMAQSSIGLTLHPEANRAQLFVVLNTPHATDRSEGYREIIHDSEQLEASSEQHLAQYEQGLVHLETPDQQVNDAFAWSQIALDQAWVCNPDLGCGSVAGYGPSRGARRPQYAWFFAGDGLVAADAALNAGSFDYARDELEFILRYQDPKTGMIWHELSQSAAFVDWAGKYPYMFVHVDITFQFLTELGRYVTMTGDVAFVRDHWNAILSAYQYCESVIDPKSGLPAIPANKEGGNEQDRMSDDLGLSTSWVEASTAFTRLATMVGQTALASRASAAAERARAEIPRRYWNDSTSFWISGHTVTGQPMAERRSGPPEALSLNLFSSQQQDAVLDQLASAAFQTDWGTRSIGAGSPGFEAQSYAKGSVWPVSTAMLAQTYWTLHRPATALQLWQSLAPLASLDSLGHFPEVLAGDVYRPQSESVPEQTWSSAGFLIATMRGLLGFSVDSVAHKVDFAPHLPLEWRDVSVKNINLAGATVSMAIHRTADSLRLNLENSGPPFTLRFSPDLPLGAVVRKAFFNRQPVIVKAQNYPQQTAADSAVLVPHGQSEFSLEWQGGVSVDVENLSPILGEASSELRIINTNLSGRHLTVDADVPDGKKSAILLNTSWSIANVSGVEVRNRASGQVELVFAAGSSGDSTYRRARAEIEFAP